MQAYRYRGDIPVDVHLQYLVPIEYLECGYHSYPILDLPWPICILCIEDAADAVDTASTKKRQRGTERHRESEICRRQMWMGNLKQQKLEQMG